MLSHWVVKKTSCLLVIIYTHQSKIHFSVVIQEQTDARL